MNLDIAKKSLGTPYYENDNCLIYNMDCLEGMKSVDGEIVNLTFTSPPYNIGKEYENILDNDDYIYWCEKWIAEVHRVTKSNGAFLLNLGFFEVGGKGKEVPIIYMLWDKTPFYMLQEIVWNYEAGVACKKVLSPRNEKIAWYVKDGNNFVFNLDDIRDKNVKYPNQKKNGKLRCNTLGKNPSNVWQIAKVTSGENRSSKERMDHPAQTPIDLLNRVILGFSNKGDLVLDPFMGSGSTAEAALLNGRKVIGFEINRGYCDLIANRMDALVRNEKVRSSQLGFAELVNC